MFWDILNLFAADDSSCCGRRRVDHDGSVDVQLCGCVGSPSLIAFCLLSVLRQTGTNTIDGATYLYDPAGNRTSKTNLLNNVTENYTYDLIYQLTQVTQGSTTTESYSYDPVGNRLSSLGIRLTAITRRMS